MTFAFAPIEEEARRGDPDMTDTELARRLGVNRRSIDRYRVRGVSAYVADRLCMDQLGVWPGEVYPDWCSARRVIGEHLARRGVAA